MADIKEEVKQQEGEVEAPNQEGAEQSGEQPIAPKKSKKKMILILVAAALVLAAVPAVLTFKKKHEETEKIKQEEEKKKAEVPIYHDLDEIIVNLNTEGKHASFMKLKITLEIKGKDNLEMVQQMMPKIRDVFQTYLRELRPSDMQGSVGLYRLREELLLRINKILYPGQVSDILFKEVLVQ